LNGEKNYTVIADQIAMQERSVTAKRFRSKDIYRFLSGAAELFLKKETGACKRANSCVFI
jgi:hypothetical protein